MKDSQWMVQISSKPLEKQVVKKTENIYKSTSLSRVNEMGMKIENARHKQYVRDTRHLINQHRSGVISRYTLVKMFWRRSKHLKTCPVCCDDDHPQSL
uniref:Uncharacterized protein n=1 Tax=Arion vulgaris TaxID=1028688 RepID=A0A0B7B2M7_9EUPU